MPVLPSYRNQSIDFLCKSINWFLLRATMAFNGLKYINTNFFMVSSFMKNTILMVDFLSLGTHSSISPTPTVYIFLPCLTENVILTSRLSKDGWIIMVSRSCKCGSLLHFTRVVCSFDVIDN